MKMESLNPYTTPDGEVATTQIDNIRVGSLFIYESMLFMMTGVNEKVNMYEAVCLEDGGTYEIEPASPVDPVYSVELINGE